MGINCRGMKKEISIYPLYCQIDHNLEWRCRGEDFMNKRLVSLAVILVVVLCLSKDMANAEDLSLAGAQANYKRAKAAPDGTKDAALKVASAAHRLGVLEAQENYPWADNSLIKSAKAHLSEAYSLRWKILGLNNIDTLNSWEELVRVKDDRVRQSFNITITDADVQKAFVAKGGKLSSAKSINPMRYEELSQEVYKAKKWQQGNSEAVMRKSAKETIDVLEKILVFKQTILKPGDPQIGLTMHYLAKYYSQLSDTKKAVSLNKQALALTEKRLPADNKLVLDIRKSLSRDLVRMQAPVNEVRQFYPLCPHCRNKSQVMPIRYGLPPPDINPERYPVVLGGCAPSSEERDWFCKKCKGAFYPYTTKKIPLAY